jgi:hypothetical protein
MRIRELVNHIDNVNGTPAFRRYVKVEKKENPPRKKVRILYEPNDAMREVHTRIRQWLQSQERFPRYLPTSPLANILPHRENVSFYQIDIHDAYGSTTINSLMRAFACMKVLWEGKEWVARLRTILEKYCMSDEGGLATGAPASTDLFNVCAAMLFDREIWRYCREAGVTYTRYVDDLTFSAPWRRVIGKRRRANIREWLAYGGFSLNHRKSVACDDLASSPVTITGLRLAKGGRIYVSREYLCKLRGMLHMVLRGKDVDCDTVNGYMGVFWSPFGGKVDNPTLTATEQRILALHGECRTKKLL